MGKKLAWLAAVIGVAWLLPAWALSLGSIQVHSRLNQPLVASIPLLAGPGEIIDETVKVRVAANEDFARAGLERLEFLSDLNFEVQTNRVVVTSRKIAREPVIDLLLEVRWGGGRLLRQYTLLLDPEGVGTAPTPLAPAPQPAPPPTAAAPSGAGGGYTRGPSPIPSAPGNVGGTKSRGLREESPQANALTPGSAPETRPASSSRPRTYGPVKPNETPWSVATKLRPDDSVTIEQEVIALFQWNPTAFNAALTGFRPGSVLRVPDADVVHRVDPLVAKSRLAEARERAAEAEPVTPKPEQKPPALQPLPPKPAAEKPPAEKPVQTETAPGAPPPKAEAPAAPATAAPAPSAAPETAPSTAAPSTPAATTTEAPTAAAPPPETPAEPAKTEEPAPTRRNRAESETNWLLYGGVALAALILIALIWRLIRRPKSPGDDFATPTLGAATAPASAARPAVAARAAEVFAEPEPAPPPRAAPPPPPPEPVELEPAVEIPEPAAPVAAAPPPPAAPPKPSFADTALTDTRQIDLEGGDALAEADFHLAYGLYDEAILLLTQALTREPGRNDVRTKLAEAYFSANRGQEFMETARSLRDKLDPAGWEKIAVLGRQLFPGEPMFGGGGKAQPAPAGETAKAAPRPPEPPKPAPVAEAAASIPFDLEPLDLNAPLETAAPGGGDAGVDLESRVSLDDPALGGDEATTKLDLAKAYIDLGDNDMARGLLGEVLQQGSSDQKQTAEELMRKLPA